MSLRHRMWTTIRLAAALCCGLAAVIAFLPFDATAANPGEATAWAAQPGALTTGLAALATVLGFAMVGGVAAGNPRSSPSDHHHGRNQDSAAQTLGVLSHSGPPGHYEPANLLQTLLDGSPDLIYFKDRESRFVCFSRSFRELLKLEDANVLRGRTDFDFFSEEHARRAFADEQEIIRTGQPLIGKLERETHTDGRVTWALTTKLPWRDRAGQIIGTFGISKNVTALKEAELKLAYEQGLFQTLLDNIPDAIYFKDLRSHFVRASHSTALKTLTRTGAGPQSAASLIGLTDFDLFGEEHARQALADEQNIIRTGKAIVGKLEQENYANGSTTWCLSTKLPWHDKDGNIIGTFGISKDITALKEAEQKLAYERELFRALVETLPDAIYFKDRESRFVKLSRSNVARATLERGGYTVLEAADGSAALELWERTSTPIAAVVTDMVLPRGPSGGRLIQTLQERDPQMRAIYISGYGSETIREDLPLTFSPGVNFLSKPFEPNALLKEVNASLGGRFDACGEPLSEVASPG